MGTAAGFSTGFEKVYAASGNERTCKSIARYVQGGREGNVAKAGEYKRSLIKYCACVLCLCFVWHFWVAKFTLMLHQHPCLSQFDGFVVSPGLLQTHQAEVQLVDLPDARTRWHQWPQAQQQVHRRHQVQS